MPASGFIAYENVLVASYTGGVYPRYDGDTSVSTSITNLRAQLVANGVSSSSLTVYENALIANQTGMTGAKYDGDESVSNVLSSLRTPLFNSYTGP